MSDTAAPDTPLPFRVKAAFGVGQIAEGIQSAVFLMFLLFFYNQVLGVSGSLCGLALALSLLFDAVTDPLIGNLSDSWRGRGGRRHPFMYLAALPLGLGFFLLFNPPVIGDWPLFGWLLGMTVLVRGAMTLYHVPHSALGAELSKNFQERTVLVAFRHFFGAIAFISVFILGFLVYFVASDEYPNGQLNPAAYGPFSGWLALAMVLTVWYSAFGTRERIPYLPTASQTQSFQLSSLAHETWDVMRNPSFRSIIIGFAIIIIAFGAAGALGLYMMTFFWALDPASIFVVSIAGPIGSMFGYVSAKPFFRWLDQKQGVVLGVFIWLCAHGLSVPLFMLGFFPEPGTTNMMITVGAFGAIASFGIAQLLVGLGTMMADIADEHELQSHQRQEGVFFGAFSFTSKSSAAIGSLIGGTALDLINWPTGEGIRTAGDVPVEVLHNLGLVWGPMASICAMPGLWFIWRYRLNRARHEEILEELAARKQTPSPAGLPSEG